jgi:RND family efflux transporter MFP subunit
MPSTPSATFPSAPRHRPSRIRLSIIIPVLVLLGGVLGGAAWLGAQKSGETRRIAAADKFTVEPRSFRVSFKEKGELKAARNEEARCEVEGRSTIIELVSEGAYVRKGDVVVELATNEIDDRIETQEREETRALAAYNDANTDLNLQRHQNNSDIRKGELAVQLAELELEKYVEGDWLQAWQTALIAIDQAAITLERREDDFNAARKLYERKFITEAEYKEDEFNQLKAGWELEKARHSLEILEIYTTKAMLAKLHSDVNEAEQELERIRKSASAEEERKTAALEARAKELASNRETLQRLRDQREKCKIRAPIDGYVIYGSQNERSYWGGNEDQVKKGAQVSERQVLLTIPDTSKMVVVTKIHESKITRIRLEQPVLIEVEGLPGRRFSGRVSRIALLASSRDRWMNPDLKEYETELTLDQVEEGLKPGQTARAEILVGEAVDAIAIPNQAVYSKAGRRFAFRWTGDGMVEPVQIALGRTNTEWAEITSGLSQGDQVLLTISDSDLRLIPELPPAAEENGAEGGAPGEGPPAGRGPGRGPGRGGARPAAGTASQQPAKPAVPAADAAPADGSPVEPAPAKAGLSDRSGPAPKTPAVVAPAGT